MGFATKSEIAAFLAALTAAERAGRPHAEMLRQMLPRIRDDDLHRELTVKLKAQEFAEIRYLGSGKDSWASVGNFFWPGPF